MSGMKHEADAATSAAHRDVEAERLVREFEACTLAGERWTHEGIQRYNLSRGVEMTKDGGYHETITLFYIRAIRRHLNGARAAQTFAELLDGLLAACGHKNFPFEYYSRERLLSWEARTGWLEPDLKSLD